MTHSTAQYCAQCECLFMETEVEGVAVIELRVNNGGSDGTSCFKIKIRTDATKLTNVRITRFRQI